MFVYSFDLSDYEAGKFTATRYPSNCCVSGDWVCLAEDDDDALLRAKTAAYHEWCAPEYRDPLDFDVDFVVAKR